MYYLGPLRSKTLTEPEREPPGMLGLKATIAAGAGTHRESAEKESWN